jgi:SET and MYND domain-containing protein 4
MLITFRIFQKLGLLEECLRDCDRAIAVSPHYVKVVGKFKLLFCFHLLEVAMKIHFAPEFQAWYRRGMVNASLKNYSSAIHDLEAALSMEVTSSGKNNIKRELQLILQKHGNMIESRISNGDHKDAELPHTGWNLWQAYNFPFVDTYLY